MQIGSSSHPPPPERLRTARILAVLEARDQRRAEGEDITQRVMSLREQIARGVYRVDPEALAATIQAAIMAGGI